MKRSPMPRRRSPLRGGAPTPKKRKPSEFARIYGSKERVEWVKRQSCLLAFARDCEGPTENAHVGNGGMGRKADHEAIIPLCRGHHALMHARGAGWAAAILAVYNLDLSAAAARTHALWLESRP